MKYARMTFKLFCFVHRLRRVVPSGAGAEDAAETPAGPKRPGGCVWRPRRGGGAGVEGPLLHDSLTCSSVMSAIAAGVDDKRHRSSSSIVGAPLEERFSERKLNARASIPEVEDQFSLAGARCDELRDKLELVKALKKKRKSLKKRSITHLADTQPLPEANEHSHFISVHTQPKQKVAMKAPRLRALEPPANPARSYVDPAMVEQHRMLGHVRNYDQSYNRDYRRSTNHEDKARTSYPEARVPPPQRVKRYNRADGDSRSQQVAPAGDSAAIAEDEIETGSRDMGYIKVTKSRGPKNRPQQKYVTEEAMVGTSHAPPPPVEERTVVELFNKSRAARSHRVLARPVRLLRPERVVATRQPVALRPKKSRDIQRMFSEQETKAKDNSDDLENYEMRGKEIKEKRSWPRRGKRSRYRARGYELPTVASQMKQVGTRYCLGPGNFTSIPFVVSKSTAPSHNIGVNIQQVLNGMKMQQPISGIPLTIAHHMGLRHSPTHGVPGTAKNALTDTSLETTNINLIKLGRRLLRLPSYKYVSYGRLLNLYREGDGMVPRFLRAMSRPQYFYSSMSNLNAQGDQEFTCPARRRSSGQEVKQSLAEYASLYREFEKLNKSLKEDSHGDPDSERRLDVLSRELNAREAHIRRVVTECKGAAEIEPLRATASTVEGAGRIQSTFKLTAQQRASGEM